MGDAGARLRQLWPESCICSVLLSVPITAASVVVAKTVAVYSCICELCALYHCMVIISGTARRTVSPEPAVIFTGKSGHDARFCKAFEPKHKY